MFSSDRRDSTEIAYELLTLVKHGASKQQMVQDANLNSRLASRYTTHLEEMGLINTRASARLAGQYRLTAKGEKVLKILSQLQSELDVSEKNRSKASGGLDYDSALVPLPSAGREEYSPMCGAGQTDNWTHTVKHFVGYLLVVLAGVGLGYLLP